MPDYKESIVPQRFKLSGKVQTEFVIESATGAKILEITGDGKVAYNGATPVGKQAALTAAKPAFTIADAEGAADNAIAAVVNASAWGFSNAAEAITFLYKVQNLHVRVGEIEARLVGAGII